MEIIGSVLVKNEDRFVEQAIRNVAGFCDRILVSDNGSTDGTVATLERLARDDRRIEWGRIDDTRVSQEILRAFAGGNSWVFGVDGDEVYDPEGLARMKARLRSGEFDRDWVVFGNVLNCTRVDVPSGKAQGYLAPPCRSMTKLYNFAAISDWTGCGHRLSGGTPQFRPGYHAGLRRDLFETASWETADFRCLHTCFTWRSSSDPQKADGGVARPNITERQGRTTWLRLKEWAWRRIGREWASPWKLEKYARGPLVEKDVRPFFGRVG